MRQLYSISPFSCIWSLKVLFSDHLIILLYIVHLFSGNQQVIALETEIKKKMEKEGLKGMVMAGGAVLAVGAIVGLGMAVASRK